MGYSISWGTVKSLAIFFGPILVPKLIGWYRKTRAAPRSAGLGVAPLPPSVSRAVQLLLAVGIIFMFASIGSLQPENIFYETESRLQIPTETLFNRVATLRPDGKLTAMDEILRAKFINMESRFLYAAYGPDAVANCLFCTTEDPKSFLFYILPDLLAPHLINLVVLGVATSTLLASSSDQQQQTKTGSQTQTQTPAPRKLGDNFVTRAKKSAAQWRYTASVAAVILMAIDVYMVYVTDPWTNKTSKRLGDVVWAFWTMRVTRFVSLGLLDIVIAALVFLSGTNRAFVVGGRSPAERIADSTRALMAVKSKMSAAGIVKNTAIRDAGLRARSDEYWTQEVALMGEVMQEREVLDGINDALGSRLNLGNIHRDADAYADGVFRPMFVQQAMIMGQQQQQERQPEPQRTGSSSTLAVNGDDKKTN